MDCRQIIHEELHEHFLLGRLSNKKRDDYERHVKACSKCKKRQRHEQALLSGLRQAGKVAMKAEIRRQVEQQSRRAWPMLYKIAAALLICILTPTLYYIYQTRIERAMQGPGSTGQLSFRPDESTALQSESQMTADHGTPEQQTPADLDKNVRLEKDELEIPVASKQKKAVDDQPKQSRDEASILDLPVESKQERDQSSTEQISGPGQTQKENLALGEISKLAESGSSEKTTSLDGAASSLLSQTPALNRPAEPALQSRAQIRKDGAEDRFILKASKERNRQGAYHRSFRIADKTIVLTFDANGSQETERSALPDSFGVTVTLADSGSLFITCQIPSDPVNFAEEDIELRWFQPQILELIISNQNISYLIDTDLPKTNARRLK